nr:MAG TPA: hypothetical protein [Caudoviricetes sp.]
MYFRLQNYKTIFKQKTNLSKTFISKKLSIARHRRINY